MTTIYICLSIVKRVSGVRPHEARLQVLRADESQQIRVDPILMSGG